MLNELEDAFRSMKSELNMRPICYQKESRSDRHIFITVVGYHILHSIRSRLKQVGLNYSWSTIRIRLSTHSRVTNQLRTESGKTIYISKCSKSEYFHKTIYDALSLDYAPYKPKRVTI